MNLYGLRIGSLSAGERAALLQQAKDAEVTYDHVGSTLDPLRWDGPAVRTHRLYVGRGAEAFAAARTALQTWVPQRSIGCDLGENLQVVAQDETVLLVLRRGPFHVIVPNRIVAVVDEPRRFAFAYGTLPGHPERGEESFSVEHLADDSVEATIRVEAGTGTPAARLVAPLVLRFQAEALRRYLRSIADHVGAGTSN